MNTSFDLIAGIQNTSVKVHAYCTASCKIIFLQIVKESKSCLVKYKKRKGQ